VGVDPPVGGTDPITGRREVASAGGGVGGVSMAAGILMAEGVVAGHLEGVEEAASEGGPGLVAVADSRGVMNLSNLTIGEGAIGGMTDLRPRPWKTPTNSTGRCRRAGAHANTGETPTSNGNHLKHR
jgi:hypothetical protein